MQSRGGDGKQAVPPGGMKLPFSAKSIALTTLKKAPSYLSDNFATCISGAVAGYCFVLFFWGPLPFFSTLWNLAIMVLIARAIFSSADFAIDKIMLRLSSKSAAKKLQKPEGEAPTTASSDASKLD